MDEKKARLMEIVGDTGVVDKPGNGETFSLDHHLIPPLTPSLMVKPKNVAEVQEIVLWANQTRTPLIPVSSGGPHFRGDTLPTASESVIVDLSGMKRILKVDRRNRLALIEPGVTYTELQPELEKEGLRIITPLLPRKNKSVIAGCCRPSTSGICWNPCAAWRLCGATVIYFTAAAAHSAAKRKKIGRREKSL